MPGTGVMPEVETTLSGLAARALAQRGRVALQELEAVALPQEVLVAVHAHMPFDSLLDCVVGGIPETWRLLQSPGCFDRIFRHRFDTYVSERDAYREEMRSSFLTACDLDNCEFYPVSHTAFQHPAPALAEQQQQQQQHDWAAAGATSHGDDAVHEQPPDCTCFYAQQFRQELQSLLWLARSVYVRGSRDGCGSITRDIAGHRAKKSKGRGRVPAAKAAAAAGGGCVLIERHGSSTSTRCDDRRCVCHVAPPDWNPGHLPVKLGAVARAFGGSGGGLLHSLSLAAAAAAGQRVRGGGGGGGGGCRLPWLHTLEALDLSGSALTSAELVAALAAGGGGGGGGGGGDGDRGGGDDEHGDGDGDGDDHRSCRVACCCVPCPRLRSLDLSGCRGVTN
jgi:hypothetical protein